MTDRDDRSYFIRRASQERERAVRAMDIGVALAHLQMAEEYERRIALANDAAQAPS